MAKLRKITQKKLAEEVEKYIRNLLEMEIEWNTAFGTTYRKNGDVVIGSLRDTIDTGKLYDSVRVTVRRDRGLTIRFNDVSAKYIFDGVRGRPEFWDYALQKLPQDLALLVAEYSIYKGLLLPGRKNIKRTQLR
jgi:hypothetical protein